MGDILVYNAANDNSLTIYRSGSIVKTIRTSPIAIAAMLKTKMIEEVAAPAPKPAAPAPKKPAAAPKPKAPAPVKLEKKAVEKVKESLKARIAGEPTLSTEEVLASIPPTPPTPPAEEK